MWHGKLYHSERCLLFVILFEKHANAVAALSLVLTSIDLFRNKKEMFDKLFVLFFVHSEARMRLNILSEYTK